MGAYGEVWWVWMEGLKVKGLPLHSLDLDDESSLHSRKSLQPRQVAMSVPRHGGTTIKLAKIDIDIDCGRSFLWMRQKRDAGLLFPAALHLK